MWNGGVELARPAAIAPGIHHNFLAPELGMVNTPYAPSMRPVPLPLVPAVVPRRPTGDARGPVQFPPVAEAVDLPRMPAPPRVSRMIIPLPNVDEEEVEESGHVRFVGDRAGQYSIRCSTSAYSLTQVSNILLLIQINDSSRRATSQPFLFSLLALSLRCCISVLLALLTRYACC